MNIFDIYVRNYFFSIRTPFLTEVMIVLSGLFNVSDIESLIRFLLLVGFVIIIILHLRNKKYAYLFIFSLSLGAAFSTLFKYLFNVSRPLGSVISVSGKSFPSYHATIATIFFVMLMYIFDKYFNSVGRVIFNSLCVAGIILICLSRLYLGVHWFSDILGGLILGIAVSYLSVKIFKKYIHKQI